MRAANAANGKVVRYIWRGAWRRAWEVNAPLPKNGRGRRRQWWKATGPPVSPFPFGRRSVPVWSHTRVSSSPLIPRFTYCYFIETHKTALSLNFWFFFVLIHSCCPLSPNYGQTTRGRSSSRRVRCRRQRQHEERISDPRGVRFRTSTGELFF